jgi:hypothetical protein
LNKMNSQTLCKKSTAARQERVLFIVSIILVAHLYLNFYI